MVYMIGGKFFDAAHIAEWLEKLPARFWFNRNSSPWDYGRNDLLGSYINGDNTHYSVGARYVYIWRHVGTQTIEATEIAELTPDLQALVRLFDDLSEHKPITAKQLRRRLVAHLLFDA